MLRLHEHYERDRSCFRLMDVAFDEACSCYGFHPFAREDSVVGIMKIE